MSPSREVEDCLRNLSDRLCAYAAQISFIRPSVALAASERQARNW